MPLLFLVLEKLEKLRRSKGDARINFRKIRKIRGALVFGAKCLTFQASFAGTVEKSLRTEASQGARAGEAGAGFVVVADEVRSLVSRAKQNPVARLNPGSPPWGISGVRGILEMENLKEEGKELIILKSPEILPPARIRPLAPGIRPLASAGAHPFALPFFPFGEKAIFNPEPNRQRDPRRG